MVIDTDAFWARVERTETCWLWKGGINEKGYGFLSYKGQDYRAHRVSYVLLYGSIPEGLQIDHLCRVRNCVNPLHLEAVTQKVNTLRGIAPSAQNARKTHCVHGHPFSGENLYMNSRGDRVCRTCKKARMRKWRYGV